MQYGWALVLGAAARTDGCSLAPPTKQDTCCQTYTSIGDETLGFQDSRTGELISVSASRSGGREEPQLGETGCISKGQETVLPWDGRNAALITVMLPQRRVRAAHDALSA